MIGLPAFRPGGSGLPTPKALPRGPRRLGRTGAALRPAALGALCALRAKRGFQVEPAKEPEVVPVEEVREAKVLDPEAVEPEVVDDDVDALRLQAESGDVKAMFRYGKALLKGWEGQEANKAEGAALVLRSAEQGYRQAQSAVGEMLFTGAA